MRVRAVAGVLPEWEVDAETIGDWSGLDPTFIREKVGVASRRFLRHDESGLGLAVAACRRLEAEHGLDLRRIGLVVLVTQNPDYRLPHQAALLQDALGLEPTTATFDVNLGCSGWVYGLTVVKGFMASTGIDDALLVTCDPYSKVMGRDSRDVIGLFGDAAAATWLSSDAGAEIGVPDFGTDGSGARHLIVRHGGSLSPLPHLDAAPVEREATADPGLQMNGRAVFNFMLARVPASVRICLEHNELSEDEVDWFVFHQASRFMLEALTSKMSLRRERVVIELESVGNTVSSTIPLAIEAMAGREELSRRTLLVSGFGVGLSWATNVLRFGP